MMMMMMRFMLHKLSQKLKDLKEAKDLKAKEEEAQEEEAKEEEKQLNTQAQEEEKTPEAKEGELSKTKRGNFIRRR